MAVVRIKDWVIKRKARYFEKANDIAKLLGVSDTIVSLWNKDDRNVSMDVAICIYQIDGTVIHPFSEESIKYEIERRK